MQRLADVARTKAILFALVIALGTGTFALGLAATIILWQALDRGAQRGPLTLEEIHSGAMTPVNVAMLCSFLFIVGSTAVGACVALGLFAASRASKTFVAIACVGLAILASITLVGIGAARYLISSPKVLPSSFTPTAPHAPHAHI